jgi:hypothetical protein
MPASKMMNFIIAIILLDASNEIICREERSDLSKQISTIVHPAKYDCLSGMKNALLSSNRLKHEIS